MKRALAALAALLFLVGTSSLAATLYLWLAPEMREAREIGAWRQSRAATAKAPLPPLLQNVRGRDPVSLAGEWRAVVDPLDSLTNLYGALARGAEPEGPADLLEVGFAGAPTLRVPGDWNTQDDRLLFYRGAVWYARHFDAQPTSGRRVFLWFGAANHRAEVYLNGRRVGVHEGGFTPFNPEVTEVLRPGENLLVVRVENATGPEDVPTAVTDWLNHGGITREVFLVEVPETFVRDWQVGLAEDPTSGVRGWVQLDGPRPRQRVRVALPELGARTTVETDASGRAAFALDVDPERWSPKHPRRYRLEIVAETDRAGDRVGFRTIRVGDGEILLNGQPIFLRGISLHEEAPFGGGRAWSQEHAETLLGWAEDLGCNFVRLAHYPHNERMVREAERRGLLVWAEIPVYWNLAFESPATRERAKRQLGEIVARDRNRAAVIFWSIGNETPATPERIRFMEALARHARKLDPTRLVTAALVTGEREVAPLLAGRVGPALLGWSPDDWVLAADDPLSALVDVPAINEYLGWYYASPFAALTPFGSKAVRRTMLDGLERVRLDTGTDKPFVVSEFGAGAVAGHRAPEAELAVWSEEYQALVYRRQLAMLERQPRLRGMSPWILKDFRSALRLHPEHQRYWNRKGLVADDGRRKLAFEVLREHYARRARAEAR